MGDHEPEAVALRFLADGGEETEPAGEGHLDEERRRIDATERVPFKALVQKRLSRCQLEPEPEREAEGAVSRAMASCARRTASSRSEDSPSNGQTCGVA